MKTSDIVISTIFIILAAIPILYGFHYIDKYGVNLPLDDQWDTIVPWTVQYYEGSFNPVILIQEQNDSRGFFTSSLLIIISVLTGMNVKIIFLIGYIMYICAILCIICLILKDLGYDKRYFILFLLPIFYYAFNPFYLYRFIYNLGSISSQFILLSILTIFLIDISKRQDCGKKSYLYFGLSIILGVMCSFSGAPGLSIWFAGIIQISLEKIQDKIKRLFLWICGALITFYLYYIALGFKTEGIHGTQGYSAYIVTALTYPLNKILCFLGVLGSEVVYNADIALFFGLLLVVLFILIVINNRDSLNQDKYSKWYALLTFGTLTALELTLTRSGALQFSDFGPPDTIFFIPGIRHSLVIFLPIMCVYILAILYTKDSLNDIPRVNKNVNNSISTNQWNFLLFGMILTLMLCASMFHILPGITAASQSYDKNMNSQYYLLNYNTSSKYQLTQLYLPNNDGFIVNKYAPKLEALKLNVFSDRKILSPTLKLSIIDPNQKMDSEGSALNAIYYNVNSPIIQIAKKSMPAVYEHPLGKGSVLIYNNITILQKSHLEFYIGLDEKIWDKKTSDGVLFEINITNSTNQYETTIFSHLINPAHTPEDRIWQYHDIDLNDFSNQTVTIKLITRPNNKPDYDWAYWGDPKIVSRDSLVS